MTQHQVFTATELVPLLRECGIDLSASQVHRLAFGTPERLSLQVMAVLCDTLSCTSADPVTTTAENADALGYHDKTISRLIKETGGTWSRYAPENAGSHYPTQ